jgi:hypothetical protein
MGIRLNSSVAPSDVARLSRQCRVLLERLQRGPATTDELSRISRKYTSRISDCRAAGWIIQCERVEGGNNIYRLVTAQPKGQLKFDLGVG